MKEKVIKTKTLLLISVVISLLINFNRLLSIVYPKLTYFNDVEGDSIPVFLFRMFAFTAYCWSILYFTINNTVIFPKFNKTARRFVFIVLIVVLAKVSFHIFIISHGFLLVEIIQPERNGISYVWIVMGVISLLLGWLLKFQLKQKINEIEKDRLIKENIQNELIALKSQINPHFLFNSLNSLNYIIRNSPEEATDFVDKLSFIFRYVLQSNEKNLVPLKEEIEFLNNYMHLARIRYGTNIQIHVDIVETTHSILIPILSIQILIENAIKHNEISKEYPLSINIYFENDYLIVKNKIQPRSDPEKSTGYGLANLSKRYVLLKEKNIQIHKNDHFIIKLPI
ncbi:sensor histidine kinase [Aquimarina algiphila]|uniref:sensor histidine kinase n=1 Tax=Aquimarina algiphila TaxID=2047982 RepID=UPI002493B571|nr:histidine kinase [Aquimarina algiphila]